MCWRQVTSKHVAEMGHRPTVIANTGQQGEHVTSATAQPEGKEGGERGRAAGKVATRMLVQPQVKTPDGGHQKQPMVSIESGAQQLAKLNWDWWVRNVDVPGGQHLTPSNQQA